MGFAQGPSYTNPTKYVGDFFADIPGVNFPRAPTVDDKQYPLFTMWRNSSKTAVSPDQEGDIWILIKFQYNTGTSQLDAIWVKMATGSSPASGGVISMPVDATSGTGTNPVLPNAAGRLTITGSRVAASTTPVRAVSSAINTVDIQVQTAQAVAGTDATRVGLCNFNSAQFTVDANGFVQLASGGGTVSSIDVDANTPPGTDPVVPSGTGVVVITGGQVATGTIGANVIRTNSLAANTFTIEIQRSTAVAGTDSTKNGVAHFDSSMFTVDANGFVQLAGGGLAIDQIAVDATSGTGTNPVVPTAAGQVTFTGSRVAASTTPVRAVSSAVNTVDIQVQTSQALAAADATKVGLCNFSSVDFTVDSVGFVQAKGAAAALGVKNIGFTYNGGTGTFTVHGADGTALSATNPGYVTVQSKANPGRLTTISVTANQDFIDDVGASEIIGNLFGLTTGIATSVDIPFFIYAVSNDSENAIAFMISRFPNTAVAPASANIGMPSSANADIQGSFFSLENITAGDYDGNPCIVFGSFRMRMSAADDWTVQTMSSVDGVGQFMAGKFFEFPRGQFGAATSKVFKNNGGTAPDDADGGYVYEIDVSGNRIHYLLAFPALDTAGVGAVTAQLALPFIRLEGAVNGGGFHNNAGTYTNVTNETGPNTNTCTINSTAQLTNAAFIGALALSYRGSFLPYFA